MFSFFKRESAPNISSLENAVEAAGAIGTSLDAIHEHLGELTEEKKETLHRKFGPRAFLILALIAFFVHSPLSSYAGGNDGKEGKKKQKTEQSEQEKQIKKERRWKLIKAFGQAGFDIADESTQGNRGANQKAEKAEGVYKVITKTGDVIVK